MIAEEDGDDATMSHVGAEEVRRLGVLYGVHDSSSCHTNPMCDTRRITSAPARSAVHSGAVGSGSFASSACKSTACSSSCYDPIAFATQSTPGMASGFDITSRLFGGWGFGPYGPTEKQPQHQQPQPQPADPQSAQDHHSPSSAQLEAMNMDLCDLVGDLGDLFNDTEAEVPSQMMQTDFERVLSSSPLGPPQQQAEQADRSNMTPAEPQPASPSPTNLREAVPATATPFGFGTQPSPPLAQDPLPAFSGLRFDPTDLPRGIHIDKSEFDLAAGVISSAFVTGGLTLGASGGGPNAATHGLQPSCVAGGSAVAAAAGVDEEDAVQAQEVTAGAAVRHRRRRNSALLVVPEPPPMVAASRSPSPSLSPHSLAETSDFYASSPDDNDSHAAARTNSYIVNSPTPSPSPTIAVRSPRTRTKKTKRSSKTANGDAQGRGKNNVESTKRKRRKRQPATAEELNLKKEDDPSRIAPVRAINRRPGNPDDHGGFSDETIAETPFNVLAQQMAEFDDATKARVKKRRRQLKNRVHAKRAAAKRDLKAESIDGVNLDLQSKADALSAENAALQAQGEVIMRKGQRVHQELTAHNQTMAAMQSRIGELRAMLAGAAAPAHANAAYSGGFAHHRQQQIAVR